MDGGAWWAAVHEVAESDTTEWLHFHFSLSCIGEGNGNPLQCSCLENPRDGEAWWAAVYGVAQSRTRLKRLSSSSSSRLYPSPLTSILWSRNISELVVNIWKGKVLPSCPTLCDPMDYRIRGILQARILEWVTFPFSRGSSQPRYQTQFSHTAGRFFTSWAPR